MELQLPELPRDARWFPKGHPQDSILGRGLEQWRSMGAMQCVPRNVRAASPATVAYGVCTCGNTRRVEWTPV